MARPTLPVDMLSDGTRISNAEREARAAMERELRGKSDRLDPPAEWSDERKDLFTFIVRECFPEDSLCNLDYFLIEELAISLDRKAKLDILIDHDGAGVEALSNVQTRQARESCRKSALDCMRDLGMSRAARAKVADKAASIAKKPLTVFDVMGDDED